MQTAGVNNPSLPSFSLTPSTVIHAFRTHTFTYTHKLTASGFGFNHLPCPLPCLNLPRANHFQLHLSTVSTPPPRLHTQRLPAEHASSLCVAYNNTHDVLYLTVSPIPCNLFTSSLCYFVCASL